ncbi:hypothetical protein [Nannocystis radixulma]|uniref:Lipoprotein n=1 Tax=Nannocystis radixulma TaxID=2995305 RepID=A0ABT5BNF0_9BACT|nr:hypothetical protein [Nannocystis radixulma]MDC0675707.1 hypothetical protein [Nannocystis radixulma]
MFARPAPRGSLLVALALLAGGPACKDPQQPEPAASAAREPVPAALLDEHFRFRIDWPGAGWTLLSRDEARLLAPSAVAGARHASGVSAIVLVKFAPGLTVDAYAETLLPTLLDGSVELESREVVTFAGEDARRIVYVGEKDGVTYRWIYTGFVRQEHAYCIYGSGLAHAVSLAALEPLLRAFSLLPGEITAPPVAATADQRGPGWRVRGGVFESAVSGLRVAPPPGWRLLVGDELKRMNPDAEVGLQKEALGAHLVVVPERFRGDAATYRTRIHGLWMDERRASLLDQWTVELAGEPVALLRVADDRLEYAVGTRVADGFGLQFAASYPPATGEASRAGLDEAFTAVALAEPAARAALGEELAALGDPQSDIGPQHSLRGGVFRDFAARVVWRAPPGFWRLIARDDPESSDREVLEFEHPASGLWGGLVVAERPGVDPDAWHAERVAARGGVATRLKGLALGRGAARFARVTIAHGGIEVVYTIATAVHGDTAIELSAQAFASELGQVEAELRQVFAGLELAPALPMSRQDGGEHVDERRGFALRVPAGWELAEEKFGDGGDGVDMAQWRRGFQTFLVMVLDSGQSPLTAEYGRKVSVQSMRKLFSQDAGEPRESAATLAGAPAERLSWTGGLGRVELVTATFAERIYLIVAENLEPAEFDATLAGFRVL